MRDRELILRFFALFYARESYTKPMKEFLTRFLAVNRDVSELQTNEFTELFASMCRTCFEAFGSKAFKPKRAVNAALADAVMVGTAERLKKGEIEDLDALKTLYHTLLENEEFQKKTGSATTDENTVKERIKLAVEAFDSCP